MTRLLDDSHEDALIGQALSASARKAESLDSAVALSMLKARVRENTILVKRRTWQSRSLLQIVSAAAVLVIGVIGIKYINPFTPHPSPLTRSYTTQPGQRAKIQLPDGSLVTLAPSSTIRYTTSFGKETRDIELSGLAVFTVVRDGYPPFIVRSNGAEARVLGTTFSVRRYKEDAVTRVVVAEGKVEVGAQSNTQSNRSVLTAGEAVGVNSNGIVTVDRNANVSNELGWVTGRSNFRSAPLRDVIIEVNRMYGMNIRLEDPSVGSRPVTVSIDGGLSPRGIASLLSGISGTRDEWHGSVVLLKE